MKGPSVHNGFPRTGDLFHVFPFFVTGVLHLTSGRLGIWSTDREHNGPVRVVLHHPHDDIRGRSLVDPWSIRGRLVVDLWSIRDRSVVDLWSIRDRSLVDS